ncbi:MAG: DnaJ domain-containing protein [Proteobacteria bacterium]|nr:DnaJ domain-containing protein [Pseudomonadota bacterium]
MPPLPPLEIQALAKLLDELDYYQVLHVERDCTSSTIKQAFHQSSRTFHPDANRHLDPADRAEVDRISKRITEAYSVLRDPRRRKAYDEKLASGGGVRMHLAEAKAAHTKKEVAERSGHTPQGRQFWQRAQQALDRGDWSQATQQLQMALTFEPNNQGFKDALAEAREAAKKKKKPL